MGNKKVWYISKYANISKYGADTRQSYFSKEFSDKGYEVTLLISNSSHLYDSLPRFRGLFKEEVHNNFRVVWLNTLKYRHPNSIARILSWIHFETLVLLYGFKNRKKSPDVVISSSLSILSVLSGSVFKKTLGSKLIFEVRDIWPQSLVELKGLKQSHPLVRFLSMVEKLGYRYSDIIVGTMGRLHRHVESQLGEVKEVVCIPHGVSVDFYENDQVEISKDYIDRYFSKSKPNFVYAGSFNQAYKLSRFVDIAKSAKGKHEANFILIGDGPEANALKVLSEDIDNLTIAPRVSRASLNSVLKSADLLLHSFEDKNVFKYGVSPNKFVDYMYAGKPTICIGKVYCPMLEESGAGTIIAPESVDEFYDVAFNYLRMTDSQKKALERKAQRYVIDQLSYKKLAEKYCELLDN